MNGDTLTLESKKQTKLYNKIDITAQKAR